MRKVSKILLLGFCLILSHASPAMITHGTRTLLYPETLDQSMSGTIDTKPIHSYSLTEIHNLQSTFLDEEIIDLEKNSYLIEFTAEEMASYLDVALEDFATGAEQLYLRRVSARVLGLLLYRLGGDGTDHADQCLFWMERQLPASRVQVRSTVWFATFSGVLIDLSGKCRDLGITPALFATVQVAYNAASGTGEIFVGTESLTNRFRRPSIEE